MSHLRLGAVHRSCALRRWLRNFHFKHQGKTGPMFDSEGMLGLCSGVMVKSGLGQIRKLRDEFTKDEVCEEITGVDSTSLLEYYKGLNT